MATYTNISVEDLQQCFDADLEAGTLRWRYRADMRREWNTRWSGKPVGTPHKGYFLVRLTVGGKAHRCLRHVIIWALAHGCWPKHQIDHRDGPEAGDGIANLREASNAENAQNRRTSPRNTSGFPGVSWYRPLSKWRADSNVDGRTTNLGYFPTPEEAFWAVLDARVEHFQFEPTPRDMTMEQAAVEAAWWFERRRWRAIV